VLFVAAVTLVAAIIPTDIMQAGRLPLLHRYYGLISNTTPAFVSREIANDLATRAVAELAPFG
jgi:hypothetical protein